MSTRTDPKNLITKSQLAELAGVKPQAITGAIKRVLHGALDGDKLDLNHTAVQRYIAKHTKKKTEKKKVTRKLVKEGKLPRQEAPEMMMLPSFIGLEQDFVNELMNKSLNEIVMLYGNEERFKAWLDAWKKTIDAKAKQLDLDHKQGELIKRETVEKYVFKYWDGLQERLLNDAPKSIAMRHQAVFNSGGTVEDAEQVGREIISKIIKGGKSKVERTLNNAK